MPLYFVSTRFIAVLPLYFVYYIHGRSAALKFRTLYPWLYEVLAQINTFSNNRKDEEMITSQVISVINAL